MKEAGMRIRIEPELRDAFMAACRSHDMPAAQVIRAFIRDYVQQNRGAEADAMKSKMLPTKEAKKE